VISNHFEYTRAKSIDDALAKLRASDGEGKFVAGGHSLIPLMKLRLSEPRVLIDIARIPGLAGIHTRGDKTEIGAGTVHHDVATSAALQQSCPMITECAGDIGDPQVRHRGTLGGSLAHADPAADYPAVMLALDAEIHLKGHNGWRTVKAHDFFKGMFTVDLASDEIIASVHFQPVKSAAYAKLQQRASRFAIVGVAAAVDVHGGTIRSARVGLTGAGSHAVRLFDVEEALAGKPANEKTIESVSKMAGGTLKDVNSDIHASREYRKAMVPVFTRRALVKALSRA
jgi:aerobic carbon-monoxide dehydrogenase medium subunit